MLASLLAVVCCWSVMTLATVQHLVLHRLQRRRLHTPWWLLLMSSMPVATVTHCLRWGACINCAFFLFLLGGEVSARLIASTSAEALSARAHCTFPIGQEAYVSRWCAIILIGARFSIRWSVCMLWDKCGTGAGMWVALTYVWWGPIWYLFSHRWWQAVSPDTPNQTHSPST